MFADEHSAAMFENPDRWERKMLQLRDPVDPILPDPRIFPGDSMLFAISWIVVLLLLAFWSFFVWALHAVAIWTLSNAGALTSDPSGTQGYLLPQWLAQWIPPEVVQALTSLVSDLRPMVDSLLQSAPALSGGMTVASWLLWAVGAVLLVLLGAGLHWLIAAVRRRGGSSAAPPPHVLTAK